MLENEIRKNQSKNSCKVKKYNNKKKIRFDRKKRKNGEIAKKKTIAKTI
jgi:hypothetical protein